MSDNYHIFVVADIEGTKDLFRIYSTHIKYNDLFFVCNGARKS